MGSQMARHPRIDPLPRADIEPQAVPGLIRRLERRLAEVQRHAAIPRNQLPPDGAGNILAANINATMDEVFGAGTADAQDFRVHASSFWANRTNPSELHRIDAFHEGVERARQIINAAIERLREKLDDGEEQGCDRILRAYNGLDLHPEIARAASALYRDGHYANAIVDAVIALNNLVRLRSGEERDGTALMEAVFSPNNPRLRFNEMRDQSDRDEQRGFMMMFSGAVAGLRNPRAHRLINDEPERALEFIAFVSLLAKLLEGAAPPAT